MPQGKIKRKVEDRGFGFIDVPNQKKDVFFHCSGLAGGTKFEDLQIGDEVDFETESSEKGLKAINVRLL